MATIRRLPEVGTKTIPKGIYKFNDTINADSSVNAYFGFICDNVTYDAIYVSKGAMEYGNGSAGAIEVYNFNSWNDEKYKIIEITADISTGDTLYTWFTANTTKQESAAKMYIGTNAVNKMYLGSKEVKKAYLGDKLVYEQKSSGETWVLNVTLTDDVMNYADTYNINFKSNNNDYTYIILSSVKGTTNVQYNNEEVYAGYLGGWYHDYNRTITFETAPTGALLTWLQANGTKQ